MKYLYLVLALCMVGLCVGERIQCGLRDCAPSNGKDHICAVQKGTGEKVTMANICNMEAMNDCDQDYVKISDGPC